MKTPLIEGSSKRFFPTGDSTYLMTFKDAVHGASQVGEINGTGYLRQAFTYYLYRILEKENIRTHLTEAPLTSEGIVVKAAEPIKLEVIVRNVARGHWVDEHKVPLFNGGDLFNPPIVEFCLKWKTTLPNGMEIDDPRVSPEVILQLNDKAKEKSFQNRLLNNMEEVNRLKEMALQINACYKSLLSQAGWALEDFKFEVGILPGDDSREFILIDEISPDSSRIRDEEGRSLTKDLFRQKRPHEEIYKGYQALKEWVEQIYAAAHH